MTFAHQSVAAIVLVTLTICLQSVGMAIFIHWGRFHFLHGMQNMSSWRSTGLMIRFTSMMMGLHLMEIMLWAGFYRWLCFPSWESSFYFSTASYSTVGYGDVVLPKVWRNLGPVESVTGVLMCGLSVSLLFAIVTRLVARHEIQSSATARHPAVIAAQRTTSRAA